jgi:hypothetical protein
VQFDEVRGMPESATTAIGRLPNLLIVGVPKAGTWSLFAYLAQHPDICASDKKEPSYFNQFGVHPGPAKGLDEYAAHFRHCGRKRYVMEATPAYFYGGRQLIDKLSATLEDPHLILLLRDPVTRLWSYFNFERGRFGLPKDLGVHEYVETCERLYRQSPDGYVDEQQYRAITGGFYVNHLGPWLETFGDRLSVVFFEHLVADPPGTVARLCRWLHIEAGAAESFDYEAANTTRQYRNASLEHAARAVGHVAGRRLRAYPALQRGLRRQYNRLNRERERGHMDETTKGRLRAIFADSNRRLAMLLSQHGYVDLPDWLAEA